jgi:hypothetical protein
MFVASVDLIRAIAVSPFPSWSFRNKQGNVPSGVALETPKIGIAASLCRLPPARVGAAIHVQYLSGDVASLREVNDGIGNVLRIGDRTHGRESLH